MPSPQTQTQPAHIPTSRRTSMSLAESTSGLSPSPRIPHTTSSRSGSATMAPSSRASLGSSHRQSSASHSQIQSESDSESVYGDAQLSTNTNPINSASDTPANRNSIAKTRTSHALTASPSLSVSSSSYSESQSKSKPSPGQTPAPISRHSPSSPSSSSSSSPPSSAPPTPFTHAFWDRDNPALAKARKAYFSLYLPGALYITLIILAVLGVFWGTLFQLPDHGLKGFVVDFDDGIIGHALVQTIQRIQTMQPLPSAPSVPTTQLRAVKWQIVPASQFPGGVADVRDALQRQEMFVAIAVSPNASARLLNSLAIPDPGYDGTQAITAFGSEGRNENSYRTFLFPHLANTLIAFQNAFAISFASTHTAPLSTSNATALQNLLAVSPQTLAVPVGYTIVNVAPFFQPIATAPVFTGLIFVLILAFFTVLVANGARLGSGLNRLLTLRSLILLRLGSAALIYLFFSLLYSLINLAFGVQLRHTYGHAGFVLFWLGTWIYMLAVGLILESWVVLLKQNIPFFFFPWLVVNLSVGVYPIEMLPRFYHYGYAAPYYNITRVVRSIVFGTRDTLALNFGVLLAWVLVGTLNMAAVQWYVRRQDLIAARKAAASSDSGPSASPSPSSRSDAEKATKEPGAGTATTAKR